MRTVCLLALASLAVSHPVLTRSLAVDPLLDRAADYVARFEEAFASVVWRESYQQEVRTRRRFAASGASVSTLAGRRVLDSELFFLWLPEDASWIAVREVLSVDGVARPSSERELHPGATRPVAVERLRQLAARNGRFNIGHIVHSFNEPTLALLFLDPHYRPRFDFERKGSQKLAGRAATLFVFNERARPTVIRDHDREVPARGTLWVDSQTGQLLQTKLELSDGAGRLSGTMIVRYGAVPGFDVLVPLEMHEVYSSTTGEEVRTTATYSDFRRFVTAGRLLGPR